MSRKILSLLVCIGLASTLSSSVLATNEVSSPNEVSIPNVHLLQELGYTIEELNDFKKNGQEVGLKGFNEMPRSPLPLSYIAHKVRA
jgi:hypothetical protein